MATEPTSSASTEKASRVRMSPDLARKMGAVGVVSASSREAQKLLSLEDMLPGLEGTAGRMIGLFEGRASLVIGADVTAGPWHYSLGSAIEKFHEDKASKGGKFGPGTYLGVGELAGETIDGLRAHNSVRHDVGFKGNILALSRGEVNNVATELRAQKGMPSAPIRTTIQNAPLTDLVAGLQFDGEVVDAVMVYMDAEQESAELAVLPGATNNLRILRAK